MSLGSEALQAAQLEIAILRSFIDHLVDSGIVEKSVVKTLEAQLRSAKEDVYLDMEATPKRKRRVAPGTPPKSRQTACAPDEPMISDADQSALSQTHDFKEDRKMMERLTSIMKASLDPAGPCNFSMMFGQTAYGCFESGDISGLMGSFLSKEASLALIIVPFAERSVIQQCIRAAKAKELHIITRLKSLEELSSGDPFPKHVKLRYAARTFHMKVLVLVNDAIDEEAECEILLTSANATTHHVSEPQHNAYNMDSYSYTTHSWEAFQYTFLMKMAPFYDWQ
jgi:hypothetical protein